MADFYMPGVWGHRPGTIRGSESGDHRTGRPSDVRAERFFADESVGNFVRI
jgi:hypothetical protein